MSRIRITVVRAFSTEELFSEDAPGTMEGYAHVCPNHHPGQEFVTDSVGCPEGFCSWAYADIRRDINHILRDGDYGWIGRKGVAFSACTDGLRPVVFKLERIED
ncbi:MAG: TIGR04076 family protein [Candidatus Bathyarchaeota archaeon]|nr:MAG: TIGR04076 family protein [Candidatus Bathyarchaeota archaeon]